MKMELDTDSVAEDPEKEAEKPDSWLSHKLSELEERISRFFMADKDLPLSQHLTLAIIALFFLCFVILATFTQLDEMTRGDGRVIPSSEIQVIQHQEGGIVQEFLVNEGEQVSKGQILMKLSDVGASSELQANTNRYLGLQAKIYRLQAEAEGYSNPNFSDEVIRDVPEIVAEEMNTFVANRNSMNTQLIILEQQLNQREQEIRELDTRISDLKRVIKLVHKERDLIAPLVDRGSASEMELIKLEQALEERNAEINALHTSLPRTKATVEEAKSRIDELKNSAKAQAQIELSATTSEMKTIEELLRDLRNVQERTSIVSPVNGTIKDIKVNTVGGVVQHGQDLIEIVPADDQLLVEAQIRPSDIAFLYPGQKAVVKITAYDFGIYGGLDGRVVDISADTIEDEQGEDFFRVKIRTEKSSLEYKGEVLPIMPGMVASVDILTGKKSVMDYLLKPFIKTLDNAMHER
jgi:adhesin transport system membrane fusion protein